MKKTLTTLALSFGLTTATGFAAPLDLSGFQRVGTVSNGAGGIFYAFEAEFGDEQPVPIPDGIPGDDEESRLTNDVATMSLLTDDFLNPLEFNLDATGGDFAGITGNLLSYEFNPTPGLDPVRTVTLDAFGSPIGFDIVGLGFGGDTIEFLLDRDDASSLGSDPYPGSAGAVFSLTSQDFSPAQGTTLDTVPTLEQFFIDNSVQNPITGFGEYAADVTFSIQALDAVAAVPAPATLALFAIGLAGLGMARQRARLAGQPVSAA